MNYSVIKEFDVANGPGVRTTLFVSGCPHHCRGCFNQDTWDFNYGKAFTDNTINYIIETLRPAYVAGLTLLGGEPMHPQNQLGLLPLLKRVKEIYPQKSIWCFTGYLFDREICDDMLVNLPYTEEFLSYIDVLVDGRYVEELRSLMLKFKGSSNQRTILVQESLQSGSIKLLYE